MNCKGTLYISDELEENLTIKGTLNDHNEKCKEKMKYDSKYVSAMLLVHID